MNTKICYLYRDADNYKQPNCAVLGGTLTEGQKREIFSRCDGFDPRKFGENYQHGEYTGEPVYFIPMQVGLPEERLGEITEADHCWFELQGIFDCGDEVKATEDISAEEAYSRFMQVEKWDDAALQLGFAGLLVPEGYGDYD